MHLHELVVVGTLSRLAAPVVVAGRADHVLVHAFVRLFGDPLAEFGNVLLRKQQPRVVRSENERGQGEKNGGDKGAVRHVADLYGFNDQTLNRIRAMTPERS